MNFNPIRTAYAGAFALGIAMILFAALPAAAHATVSFDQLPEKTVFNDFVVGPGKIELNLDPGESRTFDLTIANRLGTDKTFTLNTEDFTGSKNPEQTVVLLGDDRGPYSLRDFIHLGTTSVDIPHANRARISVTISVPADAQPGGLYGSVIVGTATRTGQAAAPGVSPTSPIITRIGTLFFVRVNGPVTEKGKLTSFSIAGGKSLLLDSHSLTFDLLFQNDGNVNLDPYGTITVTNLLGAPVSAIDVEPWFALPNSLRFREVQWNPPFLFGRYVAHAVISRGYASTSDEATVVFWVFPWKIICGVLLGLIILITLIRWVFSKFTISVRR